MILRIRLKVFTKKVPDSSKLVKETSNMLGISARYKDCCEKKKKQRKNRENSKKYYDDDKEGLQNNTRAIKRII